MKCQHKDCERTLVVECFKPEVNQLIDDFNSLDEAARQQLLKDHIEYYCPEHCQAHGYCWSCGFHQPDPALLNAEGLCPNCREKIH